jgi:ribosomal protein L10
MAARLKDAGALIIADYRGLSVGELTDLRVRLRKSDQSCTIKIRWSARLSLADWRRRRPC